MRLVGFDGKKIRKNIPVVGATQPQWFESLLGIGITVNDYPKFVQEYNKLLDTLFTKNGLVRNRALYKGYDLVSLFYGKGIDLIPQLVDELLKLVDFIDIYSYFIPEYYDTDAKIPNKIGAYYEEKIDYLSNVEFLDLIQNHFPALCCYSYLDALKSEVKDTIYCIDDCPSLLQSHAVVGIVKHPNTRFLYRGDQVNYGINAADVFCKYIEELYINKNIEIDSNIVRNLGLPQDKVQYHYIGSRWLNVIKPARRALLNINHKYPHPIYFLFTDKSSAFSSSREALENSVLFREVLTRAALGGGSVKLFELDDQDYITPQDFLITHTKNTDEKTKELIRLGCPATVLDIDSLRKR